MKNNKRKIIILLVILFVILIILGTIYSYMKKQNDIKIAREKDDQIVAEQMEKYMSNKTCPRGISTLYSNYKGKRSLNDLYKNLNNLVQYLPKLSGSIRNVNDNEISKIYIDNEKEIKQMLGIQEEEFIKLSNYLKQYDISDKKFNYCEIDSSTYENTKQYLNFNLSFYYEGIEEPIVLKTYFSNFESSNKDVIYTALD